MSTSERFGSYTGISLSFSQSRKRYRLHSTIITNVLTMRRGSSVELQASIHTGRRCTNQERISTRSRILACIWHSAKLPCPKPHLEGLQPPVLFSRVHLQRSETAES